MALCARFLLLISLFIAPALANVNQVEVVASVKGSSPVDAQQKAIDYAQKRAFFLTLNKLAPERAKEIAESLTTEQIYSLIRGYELLQDKIDPQNPNHYLAKYRVSVSEPMIRRLLNNDGAAEVDEVNPMLIFPVLRDKGDVLLWEDQNVWRSIWNSVALETGEGILVVPYGDPKDTLAVTGATILGMGFEELKPLTERYGAGEAVIVVAKPVPENTPPGLEIVMRRLGPEVNKAKSLYFETDGRNPSPEALLPQAAREAAGQLKEIAKTYQGEQLRRVANATKVKLVARFTRLNEWVGIQNRLQNLPRVVELQIGSIGLKQANATLLFNTTPEMMLEIMQASGLYVETRSDVWTVMVP